MRTSHIPPIGADWQLSSTIWGKRSGNGQWIDQASPLNGTLVQRAQLISPNELSELLRIPSLPPTIHRESLERFCARLHDELHALHPSILEAVRWETAFTRGDCEEVALSALQCVKGFPQYFASVPRSIPDPLSYEDASVRRQIDQIALPWGTVAVILPQSAFLFLAVTCLLNALATGNRVILRAPAQSARSAALLSLAIERACPPGDCVSVVLVSARSFVAALCESREPFLVHYLGSSAHAPEILSACFEAGKHALIDGEGNAWVWVDGDTPLDRASDVLTSGALRYNGQTCTSINGAVIHPLIYDRLREQLAARWNDLTFGDPIQADVQVGPLMDEAQAEQILQRIEDSNAVVPAGGHRDGNLLAPTLAADPREDSELVSHGFFGAALWIASGDMDRFAELWQRNRYPLCAGILTGSGGPEQYARRLPGLARLSFNGDPSAEYFYEPWGGYHASGTNPVSHWYQKYLRTVQVDRP